LSKEIECISYHISLFEPYNLKGDIGKVTDKYRYKSSYNHCWIAC